MWNLGEKWDLQWVETVQPQWKEMSMYSLITSITLDTLGFQASCRVKKKKEFINICFRRVLLLSDWFCLYFQHLQKILTTDNFDTQISVSDWKFMTKEGKPASVSCGAQSVNVAHSGAGTYYLPVWKSSLVRTYHYWTRGLKNK